jgi:hypothetical protein
VGLHGDHDDYGLPKVDVVVPDDARELDRDVIAYRRELRQLRRRERWERLGRPFTRYGIAAPFIASAVLIALISGILMSVISPRPGQRPLRARPAGPSTTRPGEAGGALPQGRIVVGQRRLPVSDVVNVAGVVLLVPRDCGCDVTVAAIARQANSLQLQVWLVADGRGGKDADDVRHLGETTTHGLAIVAEDPDRVLASAYHAGGLTALLVRTDRVVREVLRNPPADRDLGLDLRALQTPN